MLILCNVISKIKSILLTSQKYHDNSKSNNKSDKRTKESLKNVISKSYAGRKDTITNIYREDGGYSVVRSWSDFPRNRKQISNIRYAEKTETLRWYHWGNWYVQNGKKGSNFMLGPSITHSIFTLRLSICFASKGDSSPSTCFKRYQSIW